MTLTRKRRDTGPSKAVRQEVAYRARGRCEHCGRPAPVGQIHHRKPRGMGGTRDPRANLPINLLWVLPECHAEIELNRTASLAAGWLLTHYEEDINAF